MLQLIYINIVSIILAIFFVETTYLDTTQHAWNGYLLVNCEFLVFLYIAIELMQNGIFFVMLTTIATMLHTSLVIDGIKSIWELIDECRFQIGSKVPTVPFRCRSIVSDQFNGYIQVTSHLLYGNREIFSTIMYAFLMINIPVNISVLQRNVFMKQRQLDLILAWGFIIIQLFAAFIVMTLLSWSATVYRRPSKFIPILQPMLHGSRNWIALKI